MLRNGKDKARADRKIRIWFEARIGVHITIQVWSWFILGLNLDEHFMKVRIRLILSLKFEPEIDQ